ncbi:MAG TPA: lytic murein transglycosylase [Solirubrobacteraceae bacterium]|nr:lytic murein transglycosylase [Solirubrobacteraceae bacterium]
MIYARALLTRIIATFFALAVLSIAPAFATAEGEEGAGPNAAPVQCIASDGSLVPAPAGTPGGAPGPCPSAAPETPPPPPPAPTPEPEPEPQAQPPAQTPLDQPAPATDPQTQPAPSAGAPPVSTPTAGGSPARQTPKKPKTVKPDPRPEVQKKRKPKRERGTGPDDDRPPAPPSSLLQPVPATGGPASSGPVGSYVLPAPTTRGVPNILLDGFRVPPFLLPIYQAAGVQYGVRWEILAAINSIETDYGRNLNVSTAGALGWMQFMPSTWASYGVDANNDGRRDPYNPVDAIFAAARYLRAAGAGEDLRRAIFAYNHADWYVNDVLRRAHALSALPPEVVSSLSGMTLGRFPIAAPATYAGRLSPKAIKARVSSGNASIATEGGTRRGRRIFAKAGSPVVAIQDSRVIALGTSRRLGTFIRLRDSYGNTYTYGHLAKLATVYPVARPRKQSLRSIRRELGVSASDPAPKHAASAGAQVKTTRHAAKHKLPRPALRALRIDVGTPAATPDPATTAAPATPIVAVPPKPEISPTLTIAPVLAPTAPGMALPEPAPVEDEGGANAEQPAPTTIPAGVSAFRAAFAEPLAIDRRDVVLKQLRRGAKVIGGTVIGRVGAASLTFPAPQGADAEAEERAETAAAATLKRAKAPHLYFEVRPAGAKTPRIDPKPLLDGWRLLDSTAIYRAQNPVLSAAEGDRHRLSIGEIMLMSKEQLMRHVLDNPDIEIYECGRADIRSGAVDRRVLASLEFLAARGMKPTVTPIHCGHGFFTASGNVSEHSSGNAVDVAAINGVPIAGHQGPGSITDRAVRALLTLQGTMKPHQIITLMEYAGTDNTYAMADHWDHIHIGYHPSADAGTISALRPDQWDRLVSGLGRIRNPVVAIRPSRWSIAVTKRAPKTVAQARRHDAADRPRRG